MDSNSNSGNNTINWLPMCGLFLAPQYIVCLSSIVKISIDNVIISILRLKYTVRDNFTPDSNYITSYQ